MTLKFFASGDVVNQKGTRDFLSESMREVINSSDFSICNFEAPIKSNNSAPICKTGPHIFQAKEAVQHLRNAGFTHVSLANNHIYDYGQTGLENTIGEFKKYNIEYVGAGYGFKDAYSHKIIAKDNIKIALISACENEFGCIYEDQNRGGYAWLFHDSLEDSVRILKQEVNYVVLLAHAGVENIDFPIKEWRDRYKRLCDVGVDVVIGHHPHVPQGFEEYEKSLIFYSLGNFYFDVDNLDVQNRHNESYSVILVFDDNNFSYELVFHKKLNGQVLVIEEKNASFQISYLNNLLTNNYEVSNNDISLLLFTKYYSSYYKSAMGLASDGDSFFIKMKTFLLRNLSKNKWQDKRNLFLLHNIRIDTHRFVVQRALSLISENNE